MDMPSHTPEAKDRLRALVTDAPGVEVRPMFGALAAFVNGNMFAGVFGEVIGVKLDADSLAELRALDGSGPFLPVKPMREWAALPPGMPDAEASAWCARALEFVARLPPKASRRR